ncbi:hypothetical protein SUDANB120_02233 [Streptomyces sp. enrichment culture]|uniref:4'-phosphopantetheinyl transferase family protein n=1 Tax=Streptomyces TaxID=1883 RepID=UPI0016742DC3|nr:MULTISPECIES: 4'-phosphopantetheinyl transferase superfamily protein [Streptomyces]MBD3576854.1 4'-phosphopantetheinyl transferase superfamily protein [Streptomyces sp. KD18]GGS90007.1 hypothetical protein GCM10010286_13390 [Streptomyces toxytricini]
MTYVNRLGEDVPRTGGAPRGGAVAAWSLDTTLDVVGGHRIAEALPLLDAEERDRAERFVRPGDRHRYVASHLGLRLLLGGYLGLAPEKVALIREACPCCAAPHGRPAVAGAGVQFSLSHSDDMAYLAFAETAVGVDVEKVPGDDVVADVIDLLHPSETAELAALPASARRMPMARMWARKEACLKATGTGLADGLAEPYVGTGPDPAPLAGWYLTDLPAPPAYAAALALKT